MITVRRAAERFETRTPGIVSRHSFSSGAHYDPADTHFGVLLACDEHALEAGAGFGLHRHRDLEIVSWVVDGTVQHIDGSGGVAQLPPGAVQRLSAGSGAEHDERAGPDRPVRFIQMWVQPDEWGLPPRYEQRPAPGGPWVPLASGRRPASIGVRHAAATLWLGRPRTNAPVELPEAPFVHVFVTRGVVELEGVGTLRPGDAARIGQGGGQRLAGDESAEVLVWEMHAAATA